MVIRKRLKISGPAIVFITTTIFEWKPVLTKTNVILIIITELQNIQSLFQLSVISYVIMPNHIHLVLGFKKIEVLSKCIQGFKSVTSRRVKKLVLPELLGNDYRLWKPRFDDLIVHTEKQLKIKMDYIHSNPVKAGLVHKAEDWLYSSAADWLTSKQGLIKIDKDYDWLIR